MQIDNESATRMLTLLIREGNSAEAAKLIEKFPGTINMADGKGNTPIMMAVYFGDEMMVRLLVSKGADLAPVNANGFDALGIAKHCYDDAMNSSASVLHQEKIAQRKAIFDFVCQHSEVSKIKLLVRKDIEAESAKIYIFPSVHFDDTEADELRAWIREHRDSGTKFISSYELAADMGMRNAFKDLNNAKSFEYVLSLIIPEFKEAFGKLLCVFRDENVEVYPVDTKRTDKERKEDMRMFLTAAEATRSLMENYDGSMEKLFSTHVDEMILKGRWLHARNANMVSNIRELTKQNAPCVFLHVCGAAHATEIKQMLIASGFDAALLRENSFALKFGDSEMQSIKAAVAIRNGVHSEQNVSEVMRSMLMYAKSAAHEIKRAQVDEVSPRDVDKAAGKPTAYLKESFDYSRSLNGREELESALKRAISELSAAYKDREKKAKSKVA